MPAVPVAATALGGDGGGQSIQGTERGKGQHSHVTKEDGTLTYPEALRAPSGPPTPAWDPPCDLTKSIYRWGAGGWKQGRSPSNGTPRAC